MKRGERGAAAVELALLLPMLVLVIGGVMDIGNALRVRTQLQEAVQDGATYAALNPDAPAATRQRVLEASSKITPTVTVTCSGSAPTIVAVRAVYVHQWIVDFLPLPALTMTSEVRADVMSTETCVSG